MNLKLLFCKCDWIHGATIQCTTPFSNRKVQNMIIIFLKCGVINGIFKWFMMIKLQWICVDASATPSKVCFL